jgi:hypothetical protein
METMKAYPKADPKRLLLEMMIVENWTSFDDQVHGFGTRSHKRLKTLPMKASQLKATTIQWIDVEVACYE